jgi:membrane protein required for colicin V production
MIPFNWFDVLLAIILLASVFAGLRSGLARVVVGLLATIAGFLSAFWFYRMIAAYLMPYMHSETMANVLGFFTILFGVLLLGSAIAALLSHLLKWVGLSWFNHLLGGMAGLVRGVLLIAVIADALIAFAPSPAPDFLNHSRLLPYASPLAGWMAGVAPREVKDAFDAQMENIHRMWKPAASKDIHQI